MSSQSRTRHLPTTSQVAGWCCIWHLYVASLSHCSHLYSASSLYIPAIFFHAWLTVLPWKRIDQDVGIYLPDYTLSHTRNHPLKSLIAVAFIWQEDGSHYRTLLHIEISGYFCLHSVSLYICGSRTISNPQDSFHWSERGQKKNKIKSRWIFCQ
jgi:hypothetical protein